MLGKDHQELDRQIDQALASYAAEPHPDLSQQVLHRIASSPSIVRKRFAYWTTAAAAALAAGLTISIWLAPRHHATAPQQADTARTTAVVAPAPIPGVADQFSVRPAANRPRAAHRHSSSSLRAAAAVDPAPLTQEEKQLLLIASQHPEEVRILLAPHDGPPTPLEIEPLQTSPIESSSIHIATIPPYPISQNHTD